MAALRGEEVPEVLDPCRPWVRNSVDGSSERGQRDNVQGDVVESLPDVYRPIPRVAELFLDNVEELGPLGPESRRQVLDIFELECWLKQLPINLWRWI